MVLDDSTLPVQVDSVRVLDDKLQVRDNNLFVQGGYPWKSRKLVVWWRFYFVVMSVDMYFL